MSRRIVRVDPIQTVVIGTDAGPLAVAGIAVGPTWAITQCPSSRPGEEKWTITHVPSGLGLERQLHGPRTKVLRLCRHFAVLFPTYEPNDAHQRRLAQQFVADLGLVGGRVR